MRRIASVVLASLVALVVAAPGASLAQDGPVTGGRMELVAGGDLASLDTAQAVSTIDYNATAGLLYEGLYHFTSDGTLEPGLADGLPEISDDGLTYTFTIKPGAMFAGPDFTPREVTAADVAYGLTRAVDPNLKPAPSWGGGYLAGIKGVAEFQAGDADSISGIEVVDDQTLKVTLTAPSVTFLYGLTIGTTWPVPAGGGRGARRGLRQPPGGCRSVPGPVVEQGLGHHVRAQPGLRRSGAAVPRRDPREPERG